MNEEVKLGGEGLDEGANEGGLFELGGCGMGLITVW